LRPRQITSRHHAHAAIPEKFHRGGFVAAMCGNIKPDAEAAGWPPVAETIAENLVGEIELDPVEPAVLIDMGFVAISCHRNMLQRHRHLRRRDIAQFVEAREKIFVAGDEADAHAWKVRAFGERLEGDDVGEIISGRGQHAARCVLGVDFRVALVAKHHEAVTVGELLDAIEIVARCHRALRVGRRGEIESDGAIERLGAQRIEVRQEAVVPRGWQKHGFASCRPRAGRVGRVERVGHQDGGFALARADIARRCDASEKQPFAAAVKHQDFCFWIECAGQAESP
jgi:hypothetical protein